MCGMSERQAVAAADEDLLGLVLAACSWYVPKYSTAVAYQRTTTMHSLAALPPLAATYRPDRDPFEDAEAALRNARRHRTTFKQGVPPPDKWLKLSIREGKSRQRRTCTLSVNGAAFFDLKPIVFDVAVNYASALDLAIGACAQVIGKTRDEAKRGNLYFPPNIDDLSFWEKILNFKIESLIGSEHSEAIIDSRSSLDASARTSVSAIKEIANSGKHWAFYPAKGATLALQIVDRITWQTHTIDLCPAQLSLHGRIDFVWPNKFPVDSPVQLVFRLGLDPAPAGFEKWSVSAIFDAADRHVRATIDALRAASLTPPPSQSSRPRPQDHPLT